MPAKFDRCVRDVKRRGGARNPYAVCNAALRKDKDMPRKKHHKKHHTKHRKHHCYSSTKTGKPSKHGRYVTCHKRGKRTTRRKSR